MSSFDNTTPKLPSYTDSKNLCKLDQKHSDSCMGICAVGVVLRTLPLQSVHFPQPVSAAASEFVGRYFFPGVHRNRRMLGFDTESNIFLKVNTFVNIFVKNSRMWCKLVLVPNKWSINILNRVIWSWDISIYTLGHQKIGRLVT